jgi:hypothetical protein
MKRPEQDIQRNVFKHLAARSMPGVFILNLDLGDELSRVELSREQLSNIVADGAGMIFYTRIQPAETRR